MGKINIITISREYGSGGRIIGERLAKSLGVPFYDKVLIDLIAEESGMETGYVESATEKLSLSHAFDIAASGYYTVSPFLDTTQVVSENIFTTQSRIIADVAKEGPCVIVGRCADYILHDRDDVLNVFITSTMDDKKNRVENEYKISKEKIEQTIKKSDKARAKHYTFYCEQKWGYAENYDMTLCTATFGEDGSVKSILEAKKIIEENL